MNEAQSTSQSVKLIEEFQELFLNNPRSYNYIHIYTLCSHTVSSYRCAISSVCRHLATVHYLWSVSVHICVFSRDALSGWLMALSFLCEFVIWVSLSQTHDLNYHTRDQTPADRKMLLLSLHEETIYSIKDVHLIQNFKAFKGCLKQLRLPCTTVQHKSQRHSVATKYLL